MKELEMDQEGGLSVSKKGGFLHSSGHTVERGTVSTQRILSHLQGTDMSYRFK
jgi:hypothetical protein